MARRNRKMRGRLTTLSLVVIASLALAGFAAGSASALSITPAPVGHAGSGGAFYFGTESSANASCTASENFGKALTATTGEIKLGFGGCTRPNGLPGGAPCTSSGQASGVIATGNLNYKLIYLDAAKTKFGLWLIPADAKYTESGVLIAGSGTFANFSCAGSAYKWTGSVMGQITSPKLNVSASQATLAFTTTNGISQTYQTVEGGVFPWYHLSEAKNGGSAKNLGVGGTQTLAFSQNATFLP